MTERDSDYKRKLDELMRNAPRRMRELNRRALKRERLLRNLDQGKRSANRPQRMREFARVIHKLETDIRTLMAKLRTKRVRNDAQARADLKAELARLRESKRFFIRQMRGGQKPRRKPPEAGLAVPAEPPKGPKPKLGGAEAPLDFDNS